METENNRSGWRSVWLHPLEVAPPCPRSGSCPTLSIVLADEVQPGGIYEQVETDENKVFSDK